MTGGAARVRIVGALDIDWRERVEELLFFNPQQALLEQRILKSICVFGLPRVLPDGRSLRVEVGASQPVGTLFALVERDGGDDLAGVLLFLRREAELTCVHLSIAEQYTARGARASLRVTGHLLDGLRAIGMRIAGVEYIAIFYKEQGWYTLPLSTRLS